MKTSLKKSKRAITFSAATLLRSLSHSRESSESILSGRESVWLNDGAAPSFTRAGVKPVGTYQPRFIYRYCYGLVEPLSGEKFFVTAPQVNTLFFEFLLQEFSRQEPAVYKIIFLDKAGYHRAKQLQVPENIRLVYLPSSNPELNPIERFWRDMKDKVAFHNFKDEQELEEWITNTTTSYSQQQIASLTAYPYISNAINHTKTAMEIP